jgi:hypothetical protein
MNRATMIRTTIVISTPGRRHCMPAALPGILAQLKNGMSFFLCGYLSDSLETSDRARAHQWNERYLGVNAMHHPFGLIDPATILQAPGCCASPAGMNCTQFAQRFSSLGWSW